MTTIPDDVAAEPSARQRQRILVRAVVGLCGDVGLAVAMANACLWIIQTAALGVFLSFLVWLLGALLALMASQHVLHPLLDMALSPRKLDAAADALDGLSDLTGRLRAQLLSRVGQVALGQVLRQFHRPGPHRT